SRDHLQVEELPAGRVRLRNISSRAPIDLGDGSSIAVGETRELPLPVRVTIGQTAITLAPPTPAAATKTAAAPPVSPPAPPPSSADRPPEGLDTLPPPMSPEAFAADGFVSIRQPVKATHVGLAAGFESAPTVEPAAIGESPSPEVLTHWMETILALQRAGGEAKDFYDRTARALVSMIGLDVGLVILFE